MAQECGFFNAEYHDGEYDRVYNAEQFAAYFASFIGNGIFGGSMDELVVTARTQNNMSVDVGSGKGWINGWWYRNTEVYNIPIALADGILNRKDIIVLRWGNTERDMWLQVVQGEPSIEAVAPVIRRDVDYYDLELCEIDVPAGTSKITQAQIKDTRLDNNVCGFVTGLVDQIDTTTLYLQFQAQFGDFMDINYEQFDAWFQRMKDQLSEDAAGHLQAEIDELKEVEYTSSDTELEPTTSETVALLTSGETASSRWAKVSQMFKNIRYLFKRMNDLNKLLWTGSVNEETFISVDLSEYNIFAVTYRAIGTNVYFTDLVVKGSAHMLNAINQSNTDVVAFNSRTIIISDTGFTTTLGAFAKVSPATQSDFEGLIITVIRGII